MRPFDPRLLRRIPAVRRHLAVLGLLGVAAGGLVIGQATALAAVLAEAAHGRLDRPALAWFVVAVAGRAAQVWGQGVVAARSAATVKAQLRGELLAAVGTGGPGLRASGGRPAGSGTVSPASGGRPAGSGTVSPASEGRPAGSGPAGLGPAWLSGQRAGEIATLTGRGLDALDAYFTGYLPQLVLTVTVPLAVLARLVFADWGSALTVAVTLPLIPIFGALLGWPARAATRRQWRRLSTLGGHFLDMVTGLPTLRAFGRAGAQVETVRRMADAHRVATMRTLRIAFLSALVLELVATLSVALVAVPIGLRLLDGGLTLRTALLVLLLAPEAYLPLRAAGSRFHASMEGLTALDHAFSVLARAGSAAGPGRPAGVLERISFEEVTVSYERTTALRDVSFSIEPGERVAVVGPSGAGKSTLLALLLGFVQPTSGRVLVGDTDLATVDIEAWRRGLAWVPQRPHLFAASLVDNIRLGATDPAPAATVTAAVTAAHLDEVVATLPDGLDTVLGERGYGLSGGQRQRVALARAFLRDAPLLLLDEPTARLDTASEALVLQATRRLTQGRTALLVAHRPALLAGVDRVLRVDGGRVVELTGPAGARYARAGRPARRPPGSQPSDSVATLPRSRSAAGGAG